MDTNTLKTRTVQIPSCTDHDGTHSATVTLLWECPQCGEAHGDVFRGISYDGSRRLAVDCWKNPCGHVDTYAALRRESGLSQLLDRR